MEAPYYVCVSSNILGITGMLAPILTFLSFNVTLKIDRLCFLLKSSAFSHFVYV